MFCGICTIRSATINGHRGLPHKCYGTGPYLHTNGSLSSHYQLTVLGKQHVPDYCKVESLAICLERVHSHTLNVNAIDNNQLLTTQ